MNRFAVVVGFVLGVLPYIPAMIILYRLGSVVPLRCPEPNEESANVR